MSDEKKIGELPKAPDGEFLSAEQIAKFAGERKENIRYDTPPGEKSPCTFCGAMTKQSAYTDLDTGKSYPAYCSKSECIDKFCDLP